MISTPDRIAAAIDILGIVVDKISWHWHTNEPDESKSCFLILTFQDGGEWKVFPSSGYNGPFAHDIFFNLKNKDLWPQMKQIYNDVERINEGIPW